LSRPEYSLLQFKSNVYKRSNEDKLLELKLNPDILESFKSLIKQLDELLKIQRKNQMERDNDQQPIDDKNLLNVLTNLQTTMTKFYSNIRLIINKAVISPIIMERETLKQEKGTTTDLTANKICTKQEAQPYRQTPYSSQQTQINFTKAKNCLKPQNPEPTKKVLQFSSLTRKLKSHLTSRYSDKPIKGALFKNPETYCVWEKEGKLMFFENGDIDPKHSVKIKKGAISDGINFGGAYFFNDIRGGRILRADEDSGKMNRELFVYEGLDDFDGSKHYRDGVNLRAFWLGYMVLMESWKSTLKVIHKCGKLVTKLVLDEVSLVLIRLDNRF
jgi:hypothetical protein